MAATAMIAAAGDGGVSPAEQARVSELIRLHPDMAPFDKVAAIMLFKSYAANFELDHDIGADLALRETGDVKDKEKLAVVIRLAIAVAKADGDFSEAEKDATRQLVEAARLDPARFRL